MAKKEAKTSDSSQSRSSKGDVASLKLGKAIRNNLPKKNLISQFSSVSIDSLDLPPVSEVSDGASLAKNHVSSKFALISNESLDVSPMSEVSDGVRSDELAKKHVNSKFASVSNESLDLPLISEVSGGVHSDEVGGNFFILTFALWFMLFTRQTPVSEITYDEYEYLDDMSAGYPHSGESINSKMRSIEADAIMQRLKSAWFQIQRSDAVDIQSKKLIGTLINTVIEVFYGIPEESDMLSKVLQAKTHITVTCLLVWMMCTLVVVYVKCHTDTRFNGPLPT
uniref:Uncharacterized protein n=1 Tax=Kalanchoe fedtschenkoi TaxID=63787 RepID=A0A7N0T746_KALFE